MRKIYIIIICIISAVCSFAKSDKSIEDKASFAWGADAGASIDLTGSDMSDINFSAQFGFRRGWINFLGLGLGADLTTANSCRSYDVFADFRTNFVKRPTLLFWPVRMGASLNYLERNHEQTGFYGSTGIGINLARGKNYCSYMIIGYTFRERRHIRSEEGMSHDLKNLHYATVKIGISF